MKILTKEEESAHYRTVLKGGAVGGFLGLVAGTAGTLAAAKRYHTIRNLTLPMKTFLVTSSGTFGGIIAADHASRDFQAEHNAEQQWYTTREERLHKEQLSGMSFTDRALAFARQERYKIVGATWVASMVGSFVLVGRNPYLSGQQKIVQARVYAQGLTLAVLCASAAFEISDRRAARTRAVEAAKNKSKDASSATAADVADVSAPSSSGQGSEEGDLWKEMVAAEEDRLKKKHQPLYDHHNHHHDSNNGNGKSSDAQQPEAKEQHEDKPSSQKGPEKEEGKKSK